MASVRGCAGRLSFESGSIARSAAVVLKTSASAATGSVSGNTVPEVTGSAAASRIIDRSRSQTTSAAAAVAADTIIIVYTSSLTAPLREIILVTVG